MDKPSFSRKVSITLIVAIIVVVALFIMSQITAKRMGELTDKTYGQYIEQNLSGYIYEKIDISAYETDGDIVDRVYKCINKETDEVKFVVFSSVVGYGGVIKVATALDETGGQVYSVGIISQSETEGIGTKVTDTNFLGSFKDSKVPLVLSNEPYDRGTVEYKDGIYMAENEHEDNGGYKYFVEIEIEDGKITKAFWDGITVSGESKRDQSIKGEYIMTEGGVLWHEQANAMEELLIKYQNAYNIQMNNDGKTDEITSVSITVSDFVRLAQRCLDEASGIAIDYNEDRNMVDSISGATVSSNAVIRAINISAKFINEQII